MRKNKHITMAINMRKLLKRGLLVWLTIVFLTATACNQNEMSLEDELIQATGELVRDTTVLVATSEEGEQRTPSPTPTEPALPANAIFLDADEHALEIDIQDLPTNFSGSTLLLVDWESTRPQEEGDIICIDATDWEGNRQRFLSITTTGYSGDGEITSVRVSPVNLTTQRLMIELRVDYQESQYYLVDVVSHEIWAFKDGCVEQSFSPAIGFGEIGVACSEEPQIWHFLRDDARGPGHEIALNIDSHRYFSNPPIMFEDCALFLESINHISCVVDFRNWDSVCKEFDFWLGPISGDGRLIEVRIGSDNHPDMIGSLDTHCLRSITEEECVPELRRFPDGVSDLGSNRYLIGSAWLPNGGAMLYEVLIIDDSSNYNNDETEIWVFNIQSHQLELVGTYGYSLHFGDYNADSVRYPPPWSPDGSSVVMSVGEQYYLFNVETAELTPLTEGGILLGAITLP